MANAKDDILASRLAPLIVQLLYDAPPAIDFNLLTPKVEQYAGRTDPKTWPGPDAKLAHYFMVDAPLQFKEGHLPSQLCLCRADAAPDPQLLEKALRQTWDWADARRAVHAGKYMLIANDFMAAGLEPRLRNKLFRGFVRAVQTVAPCRAMHWLNTQLVVQPDRFVFQQDEPQAQPLYGSINVRLFNIQGTAGDCLMDTLGLAALGLPDIQCHFRGLPPSDIARILYDVAFYIFERGDIIKNGETVPGVLDSDRWHCQHEAALVGPDREVLDLNPGAPYAAGTHSAPAPPG